jgi:hypothetical protein
MKYLYIPTTTLNFNNILSTGSISPAAIYSIRRFGYKQFEVVSPNPFINLLVLYDRCPKFIIDNVDRDSYSMVIRLSPNCLRQQLTKHPSSTTDIVIYTCKETIYFEPSSAELFFADQDAQQITLNKSEPSLTTKLVELYRPRMRNPYPDDAFEWSSKILEGIKDEKVDVALDSQDTDSRINRLKGFVAGYIIGAYKSITPEIASCRSKFRTVRNILSALLNDPSRKYPKSIRNDLDLSCDTLDDFFADIDIGYRRFEPDQGDSIAIDHGELTVLRDRNKPDDNSTESLRRLVNVYCLTSEFYGQLDENRWEVALAGGKVIRTLIGAQWEGSSHKTYINNLLNIKSGTTFEFNDSDSLVMKSFAAFVLKGDDLDKLEAFLSANGIGDFRIAFALWGAMFGFSKIPKTYYNLPFQQGEDEYAKNMHAYTHSVVHGIAQVKLPQEVFITAETPVDGIPLTEESSLYQDAQDLLGQLQQKIPGANPWHAKLHELLLASGGLSKEFIKRLSDTNASELGQKRLKGTTKTAVVDFFNKIKELQTEQRSYPMFSFGPSQKLKLWDDAKVWDALRDAVPIMQQERLRDDLEWFKQDWKNPHSTYWGWCNENAKGQMAKTPLAHRTNEEAITAFCKLLISPKKNYLSTSELEDIQRLLRGRYS